MSVALAGLFNDYIIDNIVSFYPRRPSVEWLEIYGTTMIYKTKHYITYGGGPEGGFCYLYREHQAGWYQWERNWGTKPVYTMVEGQIAMRWFEDVDYIGVMPPDWEDWEGDGEILIMNDIDTYDD